MAWYGLVRYNGLVWYSYVFKLFLVLVRPAGSAGRAGRPGGWILTKLRPTKFQTKFSLPTGTEFSKKCTNFVLGGGGSEGKMVLGSEGQRVRGSEVEVRG